MRRVAITGGAGEGKSTVLAYLADAGFSTLSADAVARGVFESEEVRRWIARALGSENPSRDAVREALARDPALRRGLNARTHPAIARALLESPAQIVEAPLLVEACLQGRFERVWVVTCGRDEQLRRLVERLGSLDRAEALAGSQLPTRAKCAFADRVIRTNRREPDVINAVMEAAKLDVA